MKKKTLVISLGGSLIVPKEMDITFLHKFKQVLRKHYKHYKFVVVCGGGVIARKYISALKSEGKSARELAEAGIRATRMNAHFMTQFFGEEANETLPLNMKQVKNSLRKNDLVLCGALRYAPHSTSDGTAAQIAHFLKADAFINMTNVAGLYSANPKTHKNARFISRISWKEFETLALKMKFKAGQSFVLDQNAAVMIHKNKIPTFILGSEKALDSVLQNKKFKGTLIQG